LASLHALHFDQELFKHSEEFKPERFLDYKGRLSVKKDTSLPFGAGKRLCAGETFARNTMFLCIAALLQNFNLKPSNGTLPNLNDTACGLTRIPNDFWVQLVPK
jgi:cytochrome P450